MIYVDFTKQCRDKVSKKYGINGWEYSYFEDGSTSVDAEDLYFIRETNEKYYGHKGDAIVGDFIRLACKLDECQSMICRFEVKYLYDEFRKGGWERVDEIIDSNIKGAKAAYEPMTMLDDYNQIKERLIIRPLNYESNHEELEGKIYRMIGDFALVLYVLIMDDDANIASTKITDDYLETWKMEKEELIDAALINSSKKYPMRMLKSSFNFDNPTMGLAFISEMGDSVITLGKGDSVTCTCVKSANGAVSLFYPGVMERLSKLYGESDYYVVFTAVSECHVHKCGDIEIERLKRILSANNKQFSNDMISNKIFRYDHEKKELLVVE